MAKVIKPFRDCVTWLAYDVGDEWEGPSERLDKLYEGGFIQKRLITHSDGENGSGTSTDVLESFSSDMTVTQLREIADSRGIDVPKRAKKAELLEILGD